MMFTRLFSIVLLFGVIQWARSYCEIRPRGNTCYEVNGCGNLAKYQQSVENESTYLPGYKCVDKISGSKLCCRGVRRKREDHARELLPKECGTSAHEKQSETLQFSWMASLRYAENFTDFKCAGTLINNRYVITTSSCVSSRNLTLIGLWLGGVQYFNVSKADAICHPGYNKTTNEIALIRLRKKASINNESIIPICLPKWDDDELDMYTTYTTLQWGVKTHGILHSALTNNTVKPLFNEDCEHKYKSLLFSVNIKNEHVCGKNIGTNSCWRYNGSPLMKVVHLNYKMRTVQYGIASMGPRSCGFADFPEVYIKISPYLEWILDNLRM